MATFPSSDGPCKQPGQTDVWGLARKAGHSHIVLAKVLAKQSCRGFQKPCLGISWRQDCPFGLANCLILRCPLIQNWYRLLILFAMAYADRPQDAELEQVFGWYFATKEYLHCDALAAAPYHCRHSHGQVQTIPNHTFYILTVWTCVVFFHFDFEMCFAPQRCLIFRHRNFQKVIRHWCFPHFGFEMCRAPQRRAPFQHLNFEKCSEPAVILTFWLPNVVRAPTAWTFSTSPLLQTWGV